MSQTETLMLIALGVFTTLFLVLLFGRGLWALLGRWSGWKDARKVPRTIRDLQAERDSLKAEKAMMASKFETSVSDMKLRLAEQMAEVSRNRNRLLDANGKLQTQSDEIAKLNDEISRRDDKIAALNVQIEENVKAISQAWAKTADHESDSARISGMHKEAISAVNLREDRIRNLETEAKALRDIIAAVLPGKSSDTSSAQNPLLSEPPRPATRSLVTGSIENVTRLPDPVRNSFQARFNTSNPLAVGDAAGIDPFSVPSPVNDQPLRFPKQADTPASLDSRISNVLSLADRVRGLTQDLKKQS